MTQTIPELKRLLGEVERYQSDLRTLAEFVGQSANYIEHLIKTCDDHGVSETYTTKPERFLTEASAAITLAQGILKQ